MHLGQNGKAGIADMLPPLFIGPCALGLLRYRRAWNEKFEREWNIQTLSPISFSEAGTLAAGDGPHKHASSKGMDERCTCW